MCIRDSTRSEEGVVAELGRLQRDRGRLLVRDHPAVEEEPKPHGPARLGRPSVDGGEPPGAHPQPRLLEDLTLAGLPRRLAVGLHDAPGDRPPALVGRFEHEDPPAAVADEGP